MKTEYPPPKTIRTGEVRQDAASERAAERAKVNANAVRVKQGRRAGTGMVYGRTETKKAAELLQQFNGPPRFGKHSLICVQSIRETSETQEQFSLY